MCFFSSDQILSMSSWSKIGFPSVSRLLSRLRLSISWSIKLVVLSALPVPTDKTAPHLLESGTLSSRQNAGQDLSMFISNIGHPLRSPSSVAG